MMEDRNFDIGSFRRRVAERIRLIAPCGSLQLAVCVALAVCSSVVLVSCSGIVSAPNSAPSTPSSGILTANPSSGNFGSVAVGSQSTLSFSITNTGTATVNASKASITGAGFSAVGTSATSFSLPVGQSVTFQIQFAPQSAGAVTGSASISSDASNSPLTVSLSGTGTQGQLSTIPSTASFGSVAIGSNNSQSIQLSNGGNTDVTISQASVSGNGFSMTGLSASQVIAAGKSAIFNVSFAPTATGSFTGSVSITSNAANTPFSIALSGSGVAPTTAITVSPASLSFGNQNVNTTSGPGGVTVANTGTTSFTVSSLQTSAPFAVSGFSGSTVLSANQSLNLSVTFAPTSTVPSSGTLTITSTDPSSPNTVSMSDTGVVQSVPHLTAPICGLASDKTNQVPIDS